MGDVDTFSPSFAWRYLSAKSFRDTRARKFVERFQAEPGRRWALGLDGPTARRWLALAEALDAAGVPARGASRHYIAEALALMRGEHGANN